MQSPEGLRRATSPRSASQPVLPAREDEDEESTPPGEHIHLPPPTIYPVTVAAGVALAGFGLVTVMAITFVGLLVMFWGIYSWVQELRHEQH
jgi:hypothetical protein